MSVPASIVAFTEEAVKSSSLRSIDTRTPVKCPFTVIRPMCLAENSTWVCIGSTVQLMSVLLDRSHNCAHTIVAKRTIVKRIDPLRTVGSTNNRLGLGGECGQP